MKKLFTLIAFVIATTFSLFAHDIIVLTDGSVIRAKVIKSSSTEIEYFNIDISHGPLFLLYADEIAFIELEGGTTLNYSKMNEDFEIQSYNQIYQLTTQNYYHKGQLYNRSQMADLLKNTCDVAYKEYCKGKTTKNIGWGLLAGGIALNGVGLSLLSYGAYEAGSATITLGSMTTLASIPTIIVGRYKMNNAYKKYNNQNLSLNFGISPTGVGLALQF